jgi:hypothetical protein
MINRKIYNICGDTHKDLKLKQIRKLELNPSN